MFNNLVNLPIALITQSIIPRILGPLNYGNYSFLTSFFTNIIDFFDSGTSIAFYTKLSRDQKNNSLISFYWQFVIIVILISFLLVSVVILLGYKSELWPGQITSYIYCALILSILIWFFQIIIKILDAKGLTSKSEIFKFIQKSVLLIILISFYTIGRIDLLTFFIIQYIVFALYIIMSFIYLRSEKISLFPIFKVDYKFYFIDFWSYVKPLFFAAFVTLVINLIDRLLLQKFYGSVEQGYFSLAIQVSVICLIFTSSLTPIFTREFSIAHKEKNTKLEKKLFLKYTPLFYFIASFLSIFLAFKSNTILMFIGGTQYSQAQTTIIIMALYPVHQTYGQLCSSVLYSKYMTKIYGKISILTMVFTFPISFYLLFPKSSFGLELGSEGLAYKFIISQFTFVNILLYYVCKTLRVNFLNIIRHQLSVLAILVFLNILINYTVDLFVVNDYVNFIFSGFIYLILTLVYIIINPKIISLSRRKINYYLLYLKYQRNGLK